MAEYKHLPTVVSAWPVSEILDALHAGDRSALPMQVAQEVERGAIVRNDVYPDLIGVASERYSHGRRGDMLVLDGEEFFTLTREEFDRNYALTES